MIYYFRASYRPSIQLWRNQKTVRVVPNVLVVTKCAEERTAVALFANETLAAAGIPPSTKNIGE
jgi:hypothetical protein